MKLQLFYTIANGGDGSANLEFWESAELAAWAEDHVEEGWGEPCNGCIEIDGDNLIHHEDVQTALGYFIENYMEDENANSKEVRAFRKKFFPHGLPPELKVMSIDAQYFGIYRVDHFGTHREQEVSTLLSKHFQYYANPVSEQQRFDDAQKFLDKVIAAITV